MRPAPLVARASLLRFGWRPSLLRLLSSKRAVVLVYHGVPRRGDGRAVDAEVLESHLALLKTHFELIDHRSIDSQRDRGERIRVLLTFDDGLKNNFEVVVPILRKHNAPAVFFVANRHCEDGKYLWFAYLNALERFFSGKTLTFRGRKFDMSGTSRRTSIEGLTRLLLELRPHAAAMYRAIEEELPGLDDWMTRSQIDDCCAGMTVDQVIALGRDPLFTIGGHTCDHPFLNRCAPQEAANQIRDNLAWIEKKTGRRCDLFAYPAGDYDASVLDCCRAAGVRYGFSLIPRVNRDPALEVPRVGIYAQSDEILGFKVQWGHWLRTLKVRVG